jgi:ATP-dependent exoDNAse (exonuclease V) beta subunit
MDPLYDAILDRMDSGDRQTTQLMEACTRYLLHSTNIKGFSSKNILRELILEALAKIQEYQGEISYTQAEDIKNALPCLDKNTLQNCLVEAANMVTQAVEIFEAILENAELHPKKDFAKILCQVGSYNGGAKPPDSAYLHKDSLADCLLKQDAFNITTIHDDAYATFCRVITAQSRRIYIYSSALSLLPITQTASSLVEDLNALRKNSGKLTGSMLPGLAREVLNDKTGVSEACCRMGSRLSHLLIDEFQDTSRAQWNAIEPLAIECLSRGGSLRYVGDKKQAIYSWRGGDSRLFDEVSGMPQLLAINPEPQHEHLKYNWRSAPLVVENNNAFFSRLENPETALRIAESLLPKDCPAQAKSTTAHIMTQSFSKVSQSIPEKSANSAVQGFVGIQKISGSTIADFNEAVAVAFKRLFTHDLTCRRKAGDIAVLVRSGTEANLVVSWLKDLDLPVVTEHSFKLSANPLIQRLIGFLRFLDYPGDDLNFWGFINGPECFGKLSGLDTAELDEWLAGIRLEQTHNPALRFSPLFTFFKRDFAALWDEFVHPFYNQTGLLSAYNLISELYTCYNLQKIIPEQSVYLRSFLELVHLAEQQGHYSPAAFLDFWDAKGKDAKIPMPETPEAIRILTLHKAKGLEFPVVIMPFHRFTEDKSTDLCLFEFEEKLLLLPNSKELGGKFYQQKSASALEKLYLLYVGWTRAKEELHLLVGGSDFDLKNAGIPKALETLLADYNFSETGCYCTGERPVPAAIPKVESDTGNIKLAAACRDKRQPAQNWYPLAWLPRLKIFRSPIPEIVYNEKTRGIFLHACMENMYLPDAGVSETERMKLIGHTVELTLRNFPLPLDALDRARQDAIKALSWFCSLPKAGVWLQYGKREQSILDINGQLRRMDLLAQEHDNYYVLEYKSGKAQAEHREQLSSYLNLLNIKTENSTLTGILVYLDEQRLEEIKYA